MNTETPSLFGLKHSNKDLTMPANWGKNIFNSTFPTALALYMLSRKMKPKYIIIKDNLETQITEIDSKKLFGATCEDDSLYFAFSGYYTPFQPLVVGEIDSIDLVTMDRNTSSCHKALEIKLTALPDNTTCELSDADYGSEIVVRPQTIIYIALSIALRFKESVAELKRHFGARLSRVNSWTDTQRVIPHVKEMLDILDSIISDHYEQQQPIVMQPIWKTIGKSPQLHQDCLDIFVWSDYAFTRLFVNPARGELDENRSGMSRNMRSAVWLCKMLLDFSTHGRFEPTRTIDDLTFETKNDKAFACSGAITNRYMRSPELAKPRIAKTAIKQIILGGGQRLLSPERRFDAVIQNTPGLFD